MRLQSVEQQADEFIDYFKDQIVSLNKHDFITKKQSTYLKELKTQLADDEIIMLLDFSENMSFEVQDAAQSYYYSKPQCTIHPCCVYYKERDELKTESIIIISESLKHNVEAVYQFQHVIVKHIENRMQVKKIIFFSDGAASQYKNKKNFLNLCMFKKEFGIDAEWHFFATSHGKSPCDALGGSLKRSARLHNMKNPTNPIDSAFKLFYWAQNRPNTKSNFIFCSKQEYELIEKTLNSGRFNRKIMTVTGTQSYHSFKPIDENTISAKIFSESTKIHTFKL